MQKTIKILFDVVDERYRDRFYRLSEQNRELQVPFSLKPSVNDFIADWITIFEKHNIPSKAVVVKYVGDRLFVE